MRKTLACAVVASALFASATAGAEDAEEPRSPYRIRWEVDLPVVALGGAGLLGGLVGYHPPACLPPCTPPPGMPAVDRAVVGNYAPRAHAIANVLVLTAVAAPLVLDLVDTRTRGFAEDTFVLGETLLLTQGLTQLTKSAVDRDAPLVYARDVARSDLESADAGRSFFSGHTSTSFAAATAYAVTFWRRHPTTPWRFVVLGVGEALATSVALLKIEAGYHYPTDVVAGALVGAGLGLLVPTLHGTW